MKEKGYEDGTKAAKINDNMLWIPPWQNERQRSAKDCWSCIFGYLPGDWLRPLINAVVAGFIRKRASFMLCAPFWNWVSTEGQRFLVM